LKSPMERRKGEREKVPRGRGKRGESPNNAGPDGRGGIFRAEQVPSAGNVKREGVW